MPSQLSGLRILVLEDEAIIAMDVEQLCRESGAVDVFVAGNLREAETTPLRYDAAIIDVMLGGESTLDFARALQANAVPFVFASGYDRQDDIFANFPSVALVTKPYSGAELVDAVAASIGGAAGRSADG
ncbi:response regulator [Aminobacter sp. Piv2-1]|uniref:response regulator n=1 Tax=Aminobacter sp. Piv2-1 TaxID=3031122 RepID=UPI0030AC6506